MAPSSSLAELSARLDAVLARLSALEQAACVTPADALAARQLAVLAHLDRLEARCGVGPGAPCARGNRHADHHHPQGLSPAVGGQLGAAAGGGLCATGPRTGAAAAPAAAPADPAAGGLPEVAGVDPSGSEVARRLQAELLERGITRHKFVRAPPEYYDRPLEFRRGVVGAASVHHLCKSIVMENTKAHPTVTGCLDPNNSQYYLVVVQYTTRLHSEKLRNFVHGLSGGKIAKRFYNMRLAPEAVSDELTGFEHNGVSPVGIRTRLPIILSHRIAELRPDAFFLGAGEVDLKLGMHAADFIAAYQPFVVDCTYDEEQDEASDVR